MNVREAVQIAKERLLEAYSGDDIIHLGLEEVDYDEAENVWYITLGFSRPWRNESPLGRIAPSFAEDTRTLPRDYRIVKVRDADGVATSIKIRDVAA